MQNYYAHCYKNKHNNLIGAEFVGKFRFVCRYFNGNIDELQQYL